MKRVACYYTELYFCRLFLRLTKKYTFFHKTLLLSLWFCYLFVQISVHKFEIIIFYLIFLFTILKEKEEKLLIDSFSIFLSGGISFYVWRKSLFITFPQGFCLPLCNQRCVVCFKHLGRGFQTINLMSCWLNLSFLRKNAADFNDKHVVVS